MRFVLEIRWCHVSLRLVVCLLLVCVLSIVTYDTRAQQKADTALSQTGQYRFDSWTTDNGLPQNSVRAILQTRDGYLWVATSDGLVRFDGVRFTTFNKRNSPGITSNRISCLFEDNAGVLWIGTEDGGLTRYQNRSFSTYTTKAGLPSNWVNAIRSEPDGRLLVATRSGLILLEDDRVETYVPHPGEPQNCFGYRDREGGLWYIDDTGVHCVRNAALSSYKTSPALSLNDVRSQFPGIYQGIYEDNDHNMWIATIEKGLYRFKDGAFTFFTARDGVPLALGMMREDQRGNLWIGTTSGSLVRFKNGEFTTYAASDGLLADQLNAIYEDREGGLWVGTGNRGLYRISRKSINFITKANGLCADNVYPIFEDEEGSTWIGTWGGGLARYRDGSFSCYTKSQGLLDDNVTALAQDGKRLWIGRLGGVAFLDGSRIVDFSAHLPPQFAGTNIRAIHRARDNTLWFGTESRGLVRYVGDNATVFTAKDGLAGNAIKAIIDASGGGLWIATYDGLSRFSNGRFEVWTEADGLGSNRVRALYEDSDGVLWIGTYDGGLSRLQGGKITTITSRDGLFNDGVFQILEDSRGNFWMSSNLGIYSVSRAQLNDFASGKDSRVTCVPYGKYDGLATSECNGGSQPAGIRAHDGKLWFPTLGGVAIVDPENIPFNSQPPPVVIEGCSVDGKTIDSNVIKVDAGRQNLVINYTALSFIKSEYITFRYQLEGLDQAWIDSGTRRAAYYPYLPSGNYTFRVTAANTDGVWNSVGASISIRVVPPFYRTWWFATITVVSLAGLALLVFELRVQRLKKAKAGQEDFSRRLIALQENERKRIAAELHDSLGQSLAIIKNRALLGLNGSTDEIISRDQFGRITEHASTAIDELKDISYNLRPYLLDRLGLTKALISMLNKVADSSGIRFDTDIDEMEGLFSKDEEIGIYRIVQESVNNIVKHAAATEVMIVIKNENKMVTITVQDNGKGFEINSGENGSSRSGFGLIGIAERARILGSKVEIHSAAGCGTTITMKVKSAKG